MKGGASWTRKGITQRTIERWTARHKVDKAVEIVRGQKTTVDVAREYDLKQSEIQKWMETYLEYGWHTSRVHHE
jgi:transposase-like protein